MKERISRILSYGYRKRICHFELCLCIFLSSAKSDFLGTHITCEDILSTDIFLEKGLPSIDPPWYSRRLSLNLVATSSLGLDLYLSVHYIFNTSIICSWSYSVAWPSKLCVFELFYRLSLIASSLKQLQI